MKETDRVPVSANQKRQDRLIFKNRAWEPPIFVVQEGASRRMAAPMKKKRGCGNAVTKEVGKHLKRRQSGIAPQAASAAG